MSDLDPAFVWLATVATASIVGIVRAWLTYRIGQGKLQLLREELAARRHQAAPPRHRSDGDTSP